jgi:hypothetical protein
MAGVRVTKVLKGLVKFRNILERSVTGSSALKDQ